MHLDETAGTCDADSADELGISARGYRYKRGMTISSQLKSLDGNIKGKYRYSIKIVVQKQIGAGAFGIVFKGELRTKKGKVVPVAVKSVGSRCNVVDNCRNCYMVTVTSVADYCNYCCGIYILFQFILFQFMPDYCTF